MPRELTISEIATMYHRMMVEQVRPVRTFQSDGVVTVVLSHPLSDDERLFVHRDQMSRDPAERIAVARGGDVSRADALALIERVGPNGTLGFLIVDDQGADYLKLQRSEMKRLLGEINSERRRREKVERRAREDEARRLARGHSREREIEETISDWNEEDAT